VIFSFATSTVIIIVPSALSPASCHPHRHRHGIITATLVEGDEYE
jgi:hypothetical protein